jgi:hypothetical protein
MAPAIVKVSDSCHDAFIDVATVKAASRTSRTNADGVSEHIHDLHHKRHSRLSVWLQELHVTINPDVPILNFLQAPAISVHKEQSTLRKKNYFRQSTAPNLSSSSHV